MNQIPYQIIGWEKAIIESGHNGGYCHFVLEAYKFFDYPLNCIFINCIALSFTKYLN